jgi:uncharacterized protein with von Willebrand factor type A (vWA) domain
VALRSEVLAASALAAVGAARREDLYWAGRSTLIHRPEDVAAYDAAFALVLEDRVTWSAPSVPVPDTLLVEAPADETSGDGEAESADDDTRVLRHSAVEQLRHVDLATCTASERDQLHRAISALRVGVATRRSRRRRPAARGDELDLRRTVHAAIATGGEPLRIHHRAPSERPRRLVLLLDVSGSMEPYARALVRFAHAAVTSRGAGRVEAFTLGTRLTRITRALATRDPDEALTRTGADVEDWSGGTRLGAALREFVDRWGARGIARGAVVVVVSDGWDRGDPDVVAEAMARLHRVAHQVVWVNPLSAVPGYEPLARGMAAALPHVDVFVPGASLSDLEHLARLLATLADVSPPSRTAVA